MSLSNYPDKFLEQATKQTKNLSMVVRIEDAPDFLSLVDIYTQVRYGDNDIVFGMPNLIYGGLRRVKNVKTYLTLEGSLTISQKLEPEQGRSSISQFSLVLIDKDSYISKLCARGVYVDELLGGKEVKIYLGYQNTSWPEKYLVVFRGYITGCVHNGPKVTLTLADANLKRREQVFDVGTTLLTSAIDASQLTIPVISTNLFYESSRSDIKKFIKIDDEYIRYTSITPNTIICDQRNSVPISTYAKGAVAHDNEASVSCCIEMGPINAIDFALQLMLSGFDGPWTTGNKLLSIGNPVPTDLQNIITTNIDVKEEFGVVENDTLIITGSDFNDGTYFVKGFRDTIDGLPNRIILLDRNVIVELTTAGTYSITSQFALLPKSAGMALRASDIDIEEHIRLRNNFLNGTKYNLHFLVSEKASGKDFIESEIYFPCGCYSLTRFGRLSIGITRPPILINQKLVVLDKTTVIEPNTITSTRSMVNRRFYNEIDFSIDHNATNDLFENVYKFVNLESVNLFDSSSSMTIQSKGMRTRNGSDALAKTTGDRLLNRFSNVASEISLKCNFGAGSQIEAGDVVLVVDDGNLKLPNYTTGERNIGQQLFEVIDRSLDVKSGNCSLKLLSGIFDSRFDRYGGISPTSIIAIGSTDRLLILQGITDATDKWQIHVGDPILVGNELAIIQKIDPYKPNQIILVSSLSSTPNEGTLVNVPDYERASSLQKTLYAFISASSKVITKIDSKNFTVANPASFFVDSIIQFIKPDYSIISVTTKVTLISGNQITVDTDQNFDVDYLIEFIGFSFDKTGSYRMS